MAAAALSAQHRVGLLQVSDRAEADVPSGSGPQHLRWILRSLLALEPAGRGTALVPALRAVRRTHPARALIAVVSDFRVREAESQALGSALFDLARRHDLLPVRVRVAGPECLPPVGLVCVRDPETGRTRTLDTSDPDVRAELAERARQEEERWRTLMAGVQARWIDVDPSAPLAPQLQAGVAARRRRVA